MIRLSRELDPELITNLTEREIQALDEILSGEDYSDLAGRLNITYSTMKWYAKEILHKTGCHSRPTIIARAFIFRGTIIKDSHVLANWAAWRQTPITNRHHDVLQLILLGFDNHQISQELGIRLSTTKDHTCAIFRRLGIKRREQLLKLVVIGNCLGI